MIEGILIGLNTALSLQNIIIVMIGCFAGTIIGMLPGLGPMTAIALMIPITYGFDPASGLILMAGVYYGAVFGGSTSSILLNAPGVPGTVATAFDGYPMAQQGKAGKALAIAAYSSFAGGTISAIFLLIAAPSLSKISLSFRSPDYFALMMLGLTAVSAFSSKGQFLKAMMMEPILPRQPRRQVRAWWRTQAQTRIMMIVASLYLRQSSSNSFRAQQQSTSRWVSTWIVHCRRKALETCQRMTGKTALALAVWSGCHCSIVVLCITSAFAIFRKLRIY